MKKLNLLFLSMLLVLISCEKDSDDKTDNTPSPIIYEGSLINPSVSELAAFEEMAYDVIDGDLEIYNISSITNLSSFESLEEVTGSIHIVSNENLVSLDGFQNLEKVGGNFYINTNPLLGDYCAIVNLLADNQVEGSFNNSENLYNPSSSTIISGECSGEDPVFILDGIYLIGEGTAYSDFGNDNKLRITRNEVTQEQRHQLVELFAAVRAGSAGFQIAIVDEGNIDYYGPGSNFEEVTELDVWEPTMGLWRGSMTKSDQKFTVPEDGLYHFVYDTELEVCAMARVEMGIIGAATPGGWAESTQMETDFDLYHMQFSISNLILQRGDYKVRYSQGWKIILDSNYDIGDGNLGIKVNSNWGNTLADMIPGGSNMSNDEDGFYDVMIDWDANQSISGAIIKTGEIEYFDYSDTDLGFIGDGVFNDYGQPVNWDVTYDLKDPYSPSNYHYKWNWENIEISSTGSFKIREGQNWNNKVIGFPDVTVIGDVAISGNGDGNFVFEESGIYNFELEVDATTEEWTLSVTPSENQSPLIYLLGDATEAGWNNAAALPMEGQDGVYSITTSLTADAYFKFITQPGQWAPMYGTDSDGSTSSGNLIFRQDESDPDPFSIPVEISGTYTIVADLVNMTYVVSPAK
jgi:hypothetical protein